MFKRAAALALGILIATSVASIANADDRALRRQLEEMRSEARVALVIGNANYASSRLRNPVNDAQLMSKTLKALGFDVITVTDGTRREMLGAVSEFGKKIRNGGVGLFYFAGHGIQINGRNYLIPIGANIEVEGDVEIEGLDVSRVLTRMDEAGNRLNIVMLDACRNNPYARSFRSGGNTGLAQVDAPRGTFIAYATAPGSVAADGDGSNGVFTEEFVRAIQSESLEIDMAFRQVRSGVSSKTGGKQMPWTSSSLMGEFYFKMPGNTGPVTPSTPSQIDLSAPAGGAGFDLGDLQQRAAQVEAHKKAWASRLAEMQAAFSQVQQFEGSEALPADKKIAWERFAAAFAVDNPYSSEDDALRAKAGQRIGHWEGQAAQVAMARPQAPAEQSANYRDNGNGTFTAGDILNDVRADIEAGIAPQNYLAHYDQMLLDEQNRAEVAQAAPHRDNGDGTVTAKNGLVWQQLDDGHVRVWSDAIAYCSNLSRGGHTDWRLPSKDELAALVEPSQGSPTINQRFFPGTSSSYYWSSTTYASDTSIAWVVGFGDGLVSYAYKTDNYYVRCIR